MVIKSLGSKVRLPGFESCLHHFSAVWHQTSYLLSLFLSFLIYQMGIIRAMIPQSCRVNECQLSFSPVDTEETEAQRERKQLAQSHTVLHTKTCWPLVWGFFHDSTRITPHPTAAAWTFLPNIPHLLGEWRSKDMVPSLKLFEISHFHLEIYADLYSILYTQ